MRADGPNDTLHYVWCFHNKPTILLALTPHSANLSVTWADDDKIRSIEFTNEPYYSFVVLVNQIFEFNDYDDSGFLNMSNSNESYIRQIEMPDSWSLEPLQQNRDSVLLVMNGAWKKNESFVKEGTLRIELEAFGKEDHGSRLPHLLHSSNATQLEMSLLNVVTRSGFQQTRYAVELVIAANESSESGVFPKSFKSLDDEHTPGVFTLVDLQTTNSKEKGRGGYLQWRPVAYVADERDIVNSTETALYPLKNITNASSECDETLLAMYFGTKLQSSLLNAVNISFGAKDDGFYSKYKAAIWTATVGYGHPPDENFSLLVILIMSMCLGLPAILIVLSGLYIALHRISYRKDDLLLSR